MALLDEIQSSSNAQNALAGLTAAGFTFDAQGNLVPPGGGTIAAGTQTSTTAPAGTQTLGTGGGGLPPGFSNFLELSQSFQDPANQGNEFFDLLTGVDPSFSQGLANTTGSGSFTGADPDFITNLISGGGAPPGFDTLNPDQQNILSELIPGFSGLLSNQFSAINAPGLNTFLETGDPQDFLSAVGEFLPSPESNQEAIDTALASVDTTQSTIDQILATLFGNIQESNPLNPFTDELKATQLSQVNELITNLVQSQQKQNLAGFSRRGLGTSSLSFEGGQGVRDTGVSARAQAFSQANLNQFNINQAANQFRTSALSSATGLQAGLTAQLGGLTTAIQAGQVLDPLSLSNILGDAITGAQSIKNQQDLIAFAEQASIDEAAQAQQLSLLQIAGLFLLPDAEALQLFLPGLVGASPTLPNLG